MKKYEVTLYYHTNVTVEVEAEDEEAAVDMAYDRIDNEEFLANAQEDDDHDVVEIAPDNTIKVNGK